MDRLSADGVAVSLPSLRADSLSSSLIEQVRRVRKTGFTLAPEAGSQRLRNIINKGIGEEEIRSLIAEREEARKSKDFARADDIRNRALARGIALEDGPQGTTWRPAT